MPDSGFQAAVAPRRPGSGIRDLGSAALAALLLAMPSAAQEGPEGIVDRWFEQKWKDAKLRPGPAANGHQLIRRLSLDLTGRLPDPALVRRDAKKPARALVEQFLASPEAGEFFADLWIQWLTGHEIVFQDQIRCEFGPMHRWLKEAWTKDMPYDQFVRALLSDRGAPKDKPAVNFAVKHLKPREPPVDIAFHAARLFLGRDIRCAQCHDHPYEKLSQEEYWRFAAFFRPLAMADGALVEQSAPAGKPRDDFGEMAEPPVFFDGRKPEEGKPLGGELARFVTTTKDHDHARAVVERYWRHFFGRTPGRANAGLVDALAKDFVGHGQKPKRLLRAILHSKAYLLASEGSRDDREAYAAGPLKYMNAVQFLRAYIHVFSLEAWYQKLVEKRRKDPNYAAFYRDPENMWLSMYMWAKDLMLPKGKDPDEALASGTVRMALRMMNNRDLQILLYAQFGIVRRVMASKPTLEAQTDELFLTLLGRPATKEEQAEVVAYSKKLSSPYFAPVDTFWAIVNGAEFVFIR